MQIPGKLLFVLVKRYLCVTSLLDELGSGTEQGGEQQQGGAVASPVPEERSRLKQEFELSMAMASLILELAHAVGWEQGQRPEPPPRPVAARCIFRREATAATAPLRAPSACRPRSAPLSRSSCAEHVRARVGHEGAFRRSREGAAHAQVVSAGGSCPRGVGWGRSRCGLPGLSTRRALCSGVRARPGLRLRRSLAHAGDGLRRAAGGGVRCAVRPWTGSR